MDTKTLIAAMSGSYPAPTGVVDYEALTPVFNHALRMAGCNTVKRVALFVSQVGPESGMLRWLEELADGSDYDRYENPDGPWQQLGNTERGDGRLFKGRGPIQLTGRGNYTRFSLWAYNNQENLSIEVSSGDYFVKHPAQVRASEYDLGFLATVWYWTRARNMNSYADLGDINGGSTAVNGANPANNLSGRRKMWFNALELGDALLPFTPKEKMLVNTADETKVRAIVRAEIRDAFADFLRSDADDPDKQAPPHMFKTIIAQELAQREAGLVAAITKAMKTVKTK